MKRGAVWAKWDLHVHTPASYVQGYGKDTGVWDRFVDDLEASTQDHSVLGICDYLTVDGYERLREYQEAGRLPHLTLLPVVELRLKMFVGNKKLHRINYHVLFSETLTPEEIRNRFLRSLHAHYVLETGAGGEFAEFLDESAVSRLGAKVRKAIPPDKTSAVHESDYVLGMNSINFPLERIHEVCEQSETLRGRYLTAIGRNEWTDMSWNDASIAEKRDVINDCDFVLCTSASPEDYSKSRRQLTQDGVNDRLLDASDAHFYSDAQDQPLRIGANNAWIKAYPSFHGLQNALDDFEERVFVGDEPAVLTRLRVRPDLHIDSVGFERASGGSSAERWFDQQSLALNPELVAVIGNKGSGKSALLDSIALTGGARTQESHYSFLRRFRSGRPNKASEFTCGLKWHGASDIQSRRLSEGREPADPARVKHLPQSFIEVICNQQHAQFMAEIEQIIFEHVPEADRYGKTDFRSLWAYRSDAIVSRTTSLSMKVRDVNSQIDLLERDSHPDSIELLNQRLANLREEFRNHIANRATLPAMSQSSAASANAATLQALEEEFYRCTIGLEAPSSARALVKRKLESTNRLRTRAREVEASVADIEGNAILDLSILELQFTDIVEVTIHLDILDAMEARLNSELLELDIELDETAKDSIASQARAAEEAVLRAKKQLEAPERAAAAARDAHRLWAGRRSELVGSAGEPDSIRGIAAALRRASVQVPVELEGLRQSRMGLFYEIHKAKLELCDLQLELHRPVHEFVKNRDVKEGYSLTIDSELGADDLQPRFLALVNKNRKGSFNGTDNAVRCYSDTIDGVDLMNADDTLALVQRLLGHLEVDAKDGKETDIRQQVEDVGAMYDLLYTLEFLNPRYELEFNGRPLEELSPGEKGALLLIFYLLVESSDCPLLIDQPEENLDNQSVYTMLVPYLRAAAHRRQVIIVTHNPNIAVACNADQVIDCHLDKASGNQLVYDSGALEEEHTNAAVVDILEGTLQAFDCRDVRYEVTRNRAY